MVTLLFNWSTPWLTGQLPQRTQCIDADKGSNYLLVPRAWAYRFSTTPMFPSWHILARMVERLVAQPPESQSAGIVSRAI
jgi:hypothetical protein